MRLEVAERSGPTRELILETAERLFAEHGVYAVSNRQISEAAGQANNAAVGYHFGAKADLVRAITLKHTGPIDALRVRMADALDGSASARDWLACLVRPFTDHLATLPPPTWFARFGAQVMTDPALRVIMVEDGLGAPSMHRILCGLKGCLPGLPPEAWAERAGMTRQLMVHLWAERERSLAEGAPTVHGTWKDAGTGLINALVGLWLAPSTPAHDTAA
ncbi:regulatory protein, tetR family [Amycolatopsis saalfeldensis]|uniref:Regulatory protein, tetR family n=1 Tax=Amycolatopsis saalfeldensis TaxID=394193 RepID=A0A1H8YLK3_9PSEU|nr:TetR/AcrR family transcriptional regulator [Amycolatopsis saalfeldensis]SEP53065.1 regulatory protein, tetR family [Amycolatopsis saalfeldensis]